MSPLPAPHGELRVLLALATARDSATASRLLARAGIDSLTCADAVTLERAVAAGAGAVLVSQTLMGRADFGRVVSNLDAQPAWSDLPVIVAEHPLRFSSLLVTVRSALAARHRQYQLRSTLAELREEDRRKTAFLATLAHELRTPLAPLRSALATVAARSDPAREMQALVELMDRQVSHMDRLIDDLMEASRVSRGTIALRCSTLALGSIVRHAVEMNAPLFQAAGQTLVIDGNGSDCPVHGDPTRLTQVLSNLLHNASRFTPAGGHVHLSVTPQDDTVTIRVSDSGIGIPQDMLESVFGMFVQVPGEHPGRREGLGIGLALVRRLVELHGGRVSATSAGCHAGTTMTIELPRAVAPARTAPACPPALPAQGASAEGHRILVVDDNRDAADSLAQLFGCMGAQVAVAYGACEALTAMASVPPTMAFIDLGMPGMDGHELAERIRGTDASARLVLVALTGRNQAADRERVRRSGFDHHLVKPADMQQLRHLLTTKA